MFVGIQDFMAENFYTPAFDNYAVVALRMTNAASDSFGFETARDFNMVLMS